MRIFRVSPFGEEVDLDNPELYKYLPDNADELRNIFYREVGYSYIYMNYFHYNNEKDIWDSQRKNIEIMIKDFSDNFKKKYNDIMWLKEKVFLFQDEIENMC